MVQNHLEHCTASLMARVPYILNVEILNVDSILYDIVVVVVQVMTGCGHSIN